MTKLDDFSKIYNGGQSIARVYGGKRTALDSKDISTGNQGIKVTASTTLSGTGANMLFNGIKYNDTNRWVSTDSDTQPKLTITLDKPYAISQIVIHNGHSKGTSNFVQDVEIIIDGINQGTFIGNKTPIDINFANEITGRVIELKFPAGHNRIYEIEIYGKEHIRLIWENTGTTFAGEPTGLDFSLLPMNDTKHNTTISSLKKITLSSGHHYYKCQDVQYGSVRYLYGIYVPSKITVDITVYDKDYNEIWSQLNMASGLEYNKHVVKIDTEVSKHWEKGCMLVLRSYSELRSVKFVYV